MLASFDPLGSEPKLVLASDRVMLVKGQPNTL
jgi:hypothetical protein